MGSKSARLEKVRKFIYAQFENPAAQAELKAMGPKEFDWTARTADTIDTLLPRLPDLADYLIEAVPGSLNSSIQVFEQIKQGEIHLAELLKQDERVSSWYQDLLLTSERARVLIGTLESQQVSAEIQRLIVAPDGLGDLVRTNGNSIYPDLLAIRHDYSKLKKQNRQSPIDGPCLRGANPSNVPDGCEIKTNQGNRIRVDAHGAHAGLHLGVTWNLLESRVAITGVWVGFVKSADHRESGRNVKVTTVKYSFGHDLFISLVDP